MSGNDDDGKDDNKNDAKIVLGNNKNEDSEGGKLVSDKDITNSTTNPTNGDPA